MRCPAWSTTIHFDAIESSQNEGLTKRTLTGARGSVASEFVSGMSFRVVVRAAGATTHSLEAPAEDVAGNSAVASLTRCATVPTGTGWLRDGEAGLSASASGATSGDATERRSATAFRLRRKSPGARTVRLGLTHTPAPSVSGPHEAFLPGDAGDREHLRDGARCGDEDARARAERERADEIVMVGMKRGTHSSR
jgi:hypothetical protein